MMIWPIHDGRVTTRDGRAVRYDKAPWWAKAPPDLGVAQVALEAGIRQAMHGAYWREQMRQAAAARSKAADEVRLAMQAASVATAAFAAAMKAEDGVVEEAARYGVERVR